MLLFKERTMDEDSTYVTMQHIATDLTPLLCSCVDVVWHSPSNGGTGYYLKINALNTCRKAPVGWTCMNYVASHLEIFLSVLTHDTEYRIALNNGLNESSGLEELIKVAPEEKGQVQKPNLQ